MRERNRSAVLAGESPALPQQQWGASLGSVQFMNDGNCCTRIAARVGLNPPIKPEHHCALVEMATQVSALLWNAKKKKKKMV